MPDVALGRELWLRRLKVAWSRRYRDSCLCLRDNCTDCVFLRSTAAHNRDATFFTIEKVPRPLVPANISRAFPPPTRPPEARA